MQTMNTEKIHVKKLVKKIFTQPLANEGFKEIPTGNRGVCEFSRPIGEFRQVIQIQYSTMYVPSGPMCDINIVLLSAARSVLGIRLAGISEELPLIVRNDLHFFNSESEVEAYLTAAVAAIIDYAIPVFHCLDRPYVVPTREIDEKLAANTVQRAEAFAKQYNFGFAEDVNGIKESIKQVESVIKTAQFKPLEAVADLLIDSTAYVGELIRRVHGGEWEWEPRLGNAYLVRNVGGNSNCGSGATGVTFNYWVMPEVYSETIRAHYKKILYKLGIEGLYE